MNKSFILKKLINILSEVPDLDLIHSFADRKRFSRDFFEYSPVLIQKLEGCCAELVVKPHSLAAVMAVASACNQYSIPLTLRGAGTGNYGQCVPLQGGVVMLMNALKKIRDINPFTGEVIVESGCLMGDLNNRLGSYGRQLRLLPSTWRTASIGGFVAGGSGGIGSVRWGFLRDPGHLLGLEVITIESSPKRLELDANDSEALNHAYGTNGIITALTLATTPALKWQQVVIDCDDWSVAVELLISCSRVAVDLHLCSLLEREIVDQLPSWSGVSKNKHRLLILVAPDGLSTLERLCKRVGVSFNSLGAETNKSGKCLRELTWNHTTLHMRAADPRWTYLQMLLPQPELQAMEKIKSRWGDDLLWHLEAVRQQGAQRIAALPVVRWKGNEILGQLINQCKEIGAVVFDPHVITVEDGGLGIIDSHQVQAKRDYDPLGILNPGKLKGWD